MTKKQNTGRQSHLTLNIFIVFICLGSLTLYNHATEYDPVDPGQKDDKVLDAGLLNPGLVPYLADFTQTRTNSPVTASGF